MKSGKPACDRGEGGEALADMISLCEICPLSTPRPSMLVGALSELLAF
jgi:hypothetical protein